MMAIGEADELFHRYHPALLETPRTAPEGKHSIRDKTSDEARARLLATNDMSSSTVYVMKRQ